MSIFRKSSKLAGTPPRLRDGVELVARGGPADDRRGVRRRLGDGVGGVAGVGPAGAGGGVGWGGRGGGLAGGGVRAGAGAVGGAAAVRGARAVVAVAAVEHDGRAALLRGRLRRRMLG